jgi:putative PEP-CTERM system histidine kinase
MVIGESLAESLHWVCAGSYFLVGLLVLVSGRQSKTAWLLALGCGCTATWAALVASRWPDLTEGSVAMSELLRSTTWYAFVLSIYRRSINARNGRSWIFVAMGVGFTLALSALQVLNVLSVELISVARLAPTMLHLVVPIYSLLLLENIYFNTPVDDRWNINLLCIALATIFSFDLLLYTESILFPGFSSNLFEGRAVVATLAAPLLALAAVRNPQWDIDIHVSRRAMFHGATLVIAGVFLIGLGAIGELVRVGLANWGHIAEITIVAGGTMAIAVLLTSGSIRARLRLILVEHFFSHRYDYRHEWLRCIDLLTAPEAHMNLYLRAVRTVAAVVDSPAGIIFVRAPDEVAFRWAGSWNYPATTDYIPPCDQVVVACRQGRQSVVLAALELSNNWTTGLPRAWIIVPLWHLGDLFGFVVLARSRAAFKLNTESFELLHIVGREVGSRVAEHRAAQALAQTTQLREYGQRFSFVAHDIKNVAGQLGMLLSNAERHVSNPEFQNDMINTVRAAVEKIRTLLTRLQVANAEHSASVFSAADRVLALLRVLPASARMGIVYRARSGMGWVALNPDVFDTIIGHLINNALDASQLATAVHISIHTIEGQVAVHIADQGAGMSAQFVRNDLFRPFLSTKSGGHGIGAYQAQELARAAGGDLLVYSKEGTGTIIRLLLPAVQTMDLGREVSSGNEVNLP